MTRQRRSAFTLIELVVVLSILVILAGLVGRRFSDFTFGPDNNRMDAAELVTLTSMQTIRDAILGSPEYSGFFSDTAGYYPWKISELFTLKYILFPPNSVVGALPLRLWKWDPDVQIGWRGPYLLASNSLFPNPDFVGASAASARARGFFPGSSNNLPLYRYGGLNAPIIGDWDEPTVVDAWGNPIIIQRNQRILPDGTVNPRFFIRLVSAASDGYIDTEPDALYDDGYINAAHGRSDLVLYLKKPPPDL